MLVNMDHGTLIQWLLASVVICLTFVYWYFWKNYSYWEKRGIPYEKPWLVFGNLSFMMRKSFSEFFYDLSRRYPRDYVGIFLAWKPTLVVQSAELAKRILVKDYEYFQDRFGYSDYSSDPLGALNLFMVKNPIWSDMRHKLTPMFTSSRLKIITELMNENSRHLVQRVQRDYVENNKPVNLKELFSMYSSDTVAHSVFGIRSSILEDKTSPLWYITKNLVDWTFWRGFELTSILFIPAIAQVMRLKFFSAKATEYIRKLFWKVVEENKKLGITNEKNLVNHLIALKETSKISSDRDPQFADNLMLAQVAVFIIGAIETSACTLTYLFCELAQHPEIQEKLYNEINDAIKQKGKDILNYDDLLELKYLTACINETLRKHPVLPNFDRICQKKYKLNDEVVIEKGMPVLVNLVAIHYNESYYPQPHEWRPERFANATSYNDNLNFNFIPFGEGPRACVGKRYGLVQVRAAAAQLLHKYKLEPGSSAYPIEVDPYSYPKSPKNGGSVKFVPRIDAEC